MAPTVRELTARLAITVLLAATAAASPAHTADTGTERNALAEAAAKLVPEKMTLFETGNWENVLYSGPVNGDVYINLKGGINWVSHGLWCASCGEAGQVFNRGQAEMEAGEDPVADRLRRYDLASNRWDAVNTPVNGNHGYSHTAIDEAGKRIISIRSGERGIDVWDAETLDHVGVFGTPSVPWGNTWALTIHPNLGPHGRLFLVYVTGGNNELWALDLPAAGLPDAGGWRLHRGIDAWDGTTGGQQGTPIAHYHPSLDAILFGASGPALNEIFQVDRHNRLTRLDNAPLIFRVPAPGSEGGHLIPVPNQPYWEYWAAALDADGRIIKDKYLTMRYRLDPAAPPGSQWTVVGEMDRTEGKHPDGGNTVQRWFTTAIPEHNVVLVVDERVNMLFKFDHR